jgi:hypothetical protein
VAHDPATQWIPHRQVIAGNGRDHCDSRKPPAAARSWWPAEAVIVGEAPPAIPPVLSQFAGAHVPSVPTLEKPFGDFPAEVLVAVHLPADCHRTLYPHRGEIPLCVLLRVRSLRSGNGGSFAVPSIGSGSRIVRLLVVIRHQNRPLLEAQT